MEDTRPKFLESVTEHPDVQRLIKQVVRSDLRIKELQAENERLKDKHSYCAIHNTYPDTDEPCYACCNKAIDDHDKALKGDINDD